MLRQELQIKLRLNLNLLLKNQVEVLLYPAQEFEQILKEEQEANPFIEEITLSPKARELFEDRRPPEVAHRPSPLETFMKNIRAELEGTDLAIAEEIVSGLDHRGFFVGSVEAIADKFRVSPEYVEDIREFIMRLEPLGVGSRNLEEFLRVQIEELYPGERDLLNFLEKALRGHRIPKEVREKLSHLRRTPLSGEEIPYRIARVDAVIDIDDGKLVGYLYEDFVDIKVNPRYAELISKAKGKTREFLREYLERCNTFRKILSLRRENLRKILNEIIEVQGDFLKGEGNLRTLLVKDVASKLGVSESTVSRLINSKYVKTPQGTYPFRFFFVRESVSGISQEELMRKIREIVASEDPSRPYSDEEIAGILSSQGFRVARRTVAKYREILGIPSSRERRRSVLR
ncbi:MAG: RNA polymerase factor sigma-54 [Aquificota bacterium]|nr:RNA polymerase factor sigma-54 [Aquificota bacterium]